MMHEQMISLIFAAMKNRMLFLVLLLPMLAGCQFQRIMKKTYEITAEQMLTKIRMNRAQELLISTEMTLESIGNVVGYQSVYSFSKAFRSWS